MRYRYIYNVTQTHQGKHIFDPSHLKEGTKMMWHGDDGAQVHVEIKSFDGKNAVVQYDDGPKKGEIDVLSLADLHDRLDDVSGGGKARLSEARVKEEKKLADMHSRGVSSKQLARQKKRVEALGGVPAAAPLGLPPSAPVAARHAAKKIEDTLSQLDAARADQMRPKFEKLIQELVSTMENEKRVRSSSGNALRGTSSAINKVEQAKYKLTQLWNRALQEAQAPSNESESNDNQPPTKKNESTTKEATRGDRIAEALEASAQADVLGEEGKRTKLSKDADKALMEATQAFIESNFSTDKNPALLAESQMTPRDYAHMRLLGGVSQLKEAQKPARIGKYAITSRQHKEAQDDREQARRHIKEALADLARNDQ